MDLWALSDLCTPWCIHVVVTLRIADHMQAGRNDSASLAAACGADPDYLERVIRHLVTKGIFEEPEAGRFILNAAAQPLLEDGFKLGFDLDGFGGRMAFAWGSLLSAVRNGKPGYHEVFGRPFWDDLNVNPELAANFDALMGPAGHGTPSPDVLLNADDWASVRTVVDVGGGTGAQLAEILKARPNLRGILVDLPKTIARSEETFTDAGVQDRVTGFGQSFFDALPTGGDLYLLKNVLSDWPDLEARIILQRCADAARESPNGRVVVLGGVNPGPVADPELLMLVLVGGKDRTLEDFRSLARLAGLEIDAAGVLPSSNKYAVECRPVRA